MNTTMKANNDFSTHSAKGLGGASVRRAAMMLLMMLLTATAWAGEYTVTYQAKITSSPTSGLYYISLVRSGNSSQSVTIAEKSSAWPGNTGVCVNDEYDVTFKPSQNLPVATNPGTTTAIGFNMSSGTTITASVASNSSYYVKQVRLLDNGTQKATSAAMAPNSRSATVTASGNIQFNFIEVTITDDFYGTITPQNGLTLATAASLTYNSTNYYKSGTEVTMNAPANRAIDAATGVSGATIAANKRSYTFTMPKQDVSPDASMSEVHTISCPSGLTVTSTPYCTDNTTKYYKKDQTYTLTADADKRITSFNASGASGSSVASDKKSATVTIGSSNVTVTATLQTISGTTTDGLSWSLAQDGSGNYTRLTISGTGAMKVYDHEKVGGLWRTDAPWGYGITSVTVGDGVTSIGTQAFIGCQSLATVTLGSSVTTIGNNAFDHCDALTQITLPASVTTLNDEAFKNCSGLERIDIGHDGAVTLGSNVFQNCGALQYIVFPSPAAVQANTTGNWSSLTGKLRAKFGSQLFGVTKDKTNTAVYAIATAADLRNLATAVNSENNGSGKTFLQTANIDLGGSSSPFTPIGYGEYFRGTYDGGSHTVSRLYIYAGNDNNVGFFGRVSNGTVRNVILISPDVTNTFNKNSYEIRVGALIGYAYKATVENCFAVSPTLNATGSGTKDIGALIGETRNSTRVTNCSFYAGNATTGIGYRDDTTNGDVSRAYKVTLGSNAGLPNPPATGGFIVQGSHYYAQGATAQLSYTGSIPNGYRPVFTVSPDNTGATVTQQVVLTMGSADITITASLSSTPLIDISTGTIADIPDQDYTGSAIVPDITLTVGGQLLTEGTDYLVSCTNNVNLGTATLTATGMGDYTGTLTKDFRICYADKTGSCGNGVTYTLHDEDQNGHYEQLTISGTGAMTDYASQDDVPWAAKCDDINSVTVQSGVTSIGARAFDWCRYLTSVSLPEGLTSIGEGAFRYCQSLPSLTVPASVESVGIEAFKFLAYDISGCTLTFASGSRLTSVGGDAFYYAKASVDMSTCTSLTSVPNAFQYFDGNVTFPRSLTSIAKWCFNHGKSATKVYIDVPDNYLLTVNNESVSATNGKADITSNIGVGTSHSAVTLSCIPNPAHFSQSGDEYTIHTATGWNIFCDILNDYPKGYFTGKTVRLGDNISVSRMAGSSNHDFTGTFDGGGRTLTVNYGTADSPISENYAAPFRNVTTTKADPNDAADTPAAIRDLKVNGSIYTSAKYAAGIVANQYGTVNISNCSVSVRIHSSHSGDGTHGGLVAIQHNALTVEGCVFAGRLLTTNGTTDCGGLVGYHSSGTCTISNCLYEPVALSTSESYINSGATFCRNYDGTPVNCYYSATLGTAQGKARRTVTAGEGVTISNIALTGSSEYYDGSGIRAYDNGGIKYYNTLYYGSGDQVSLTLTNTPTTGYGFDGYTASPDGATLTEDGDNYTLTMPDEDVTIGATFSLLPGIVYYIDDKGNGQTLQPADYTELTGGGETTLAAGWYVAQGTDPINYTGKITLSGDVNIILADGCTLNIGTEQQRISSSNCISGGDYTLTIYGQADGDGTLNAYNNSSNNSSVYVKNYAQHGGNVTLDGIKVVLDLNGGLLTLTRGTLTANTTNIYIPVINLEGNTTTISGGTLTITVDGTVKACGNTAISGNLALSGTATVSLSGAVVAPGTVTIAAGQVFTDGNGHYYAGTLTADEKNAINGQTLTRLTALQLADAADNSAAITKCNGATGLDITLKDRTLWKDGAWNTLCLPFDMTIAGSILDGDGVDVRTLSSSDFQDGTLTLDFTPASGEGAVTAIEAGKPYIIKWGTPESNPGTTLTDPVFSGVTVSSTPANVSTGYVDFIGTYSPVGIYEDGDEKHNLYLGADNSLYYPTAEGFHVNAFRAWFQLKKGLTAGEPSSPNAVRAFNLHFGEETNAVFDLNNKEEIINNNWFSLDGVKLDGKPTKKGLYIHGGRKVVVP